MPTPIKARVKFVEAGQVQQLWPLFPPYIGCTFKLDGMFHDCRVLIDTPVQPGDGRVLEIQFLRPDLVMPKLRIGSLFELKTIPIIAEGQVIEM
jgi:hypothetical protein